MTLFMEILVFVILFAIFTDDGCPYDPMGKPDPDTRAVAEERIAGGMGIFIVKSFMDSVEYSYRDERNNKTVLAIARPMRTASGTDKVVVLSDGTAAEQGTPEELMNTGKI